MSTTGDRPRREWRTVDGIVLLDKPVGMSSNQALQRVRRLYSARKAGHTGALDPLATGVLPLCFGQATKVAGLMLDADKTYRATLALGTRTATGDREGEIVETRPLPALGRGDVQDVLARFLGSSQQVPPMYSALKRDGEPLYKLARRGVEVVREPRPIRIDAIELVELDGPTLSFDVTCSKGTYVRTLGEDIASALGTTGHLAALRRTDVGGALAGLPAHPIEYLESLAADARRAALVGGCDPQGPAGGRARRAGDGRAAARSGRRRRERPRRRGSTVCRGRAVSRSGRDGRRRRARAAGTAHDGSGVTSARPDRFCTLYGGSPNTYASRKISIWNSALR